MIAWACECCFCRYDSITIDGQLIYQNQLNDKNKPFFDICDGIFVNYSWSVLLYLHLSLPHEVHYVCVTFIYIFREQEDYPRLSAAAAGERKHDVYTGIDVFGRGTFGGGQWNVCCVLWDSEFLTNNFVLSYDCNFLLIRQMLHLMCWKRMMFQLPYLLLDGSTKRSNPQNLRLLKIGKTVTVIKKYTNLAHAHASMFIT